MTSLLRSSDPEKHVTVGPSHAHIIPQKDWFDEEQLEDMFSQAGLVDVKVEIAAGGEGLSFFGGKSPDIFVARGTKPPQSD
jgi:hypothetical protein